MTYLVTKGVCCANNIPPMGKIVGGRGGLSKEQQSLASRWDKNTCVNKHACK